MPNQVNVEGAPDLGGALTHLADLAGLIAHEEGVRLAELAYRVPEVECVVEVGAFKGKSAAYMASGAALGGGAHVYSVDLWTLGGQRKAERNYSKPRVFERYKQQTAGLAVTPIAGKGYDVAHEWTGPPVGLLFIDGDHTFEGCLADMVSWGRHLAPGAHVCFHDYEPRFPGVVRVVDDYLPDGWVRLPDVRHLAVARVP